MRIRVRPRYIVGELRTRTLSTLSARRRTKSTFISIRTGLDCSTFMHKIIQQRFSLFTYVYTHVSSQSLNLDSCRRGASNKCSAGARRIVAAEKVSRKVAEEERENENG